MQKASIYEYVRVVRCFYYEIHIYVYKWVSLHLWIYKKILDGTHINIICPVNFQIIYYYYYYLSCFEENAELF